MLTNNFPNSKYRVLINVLTLERRLSMDLAHSLALVRGKLLNLHHCHNPSLLSCMCEDDTYYILQLIPAQSLGNFNKRLMQYKNILALTRVAYNGITPEKCVTVMMITCFVSLFI